MKEIVNLGFSVEDLYMAAEQSQDQVLGKMLRGVLGLVAEYQNEDVHAACKGHEKNLSDLCIRFQEESEGRAKMLREWEVTIRDLRRELFELKMKHGLLSLTDEEIQALGVPFTRHEDGTCSGGKIPVIRSVKTRLGLGLKEAKDLVEATMHRLLLCPK